MQSNWPTRPEVRLAQGPGQPARCAPTEPIGDRRSNSRTLGRNEGLKKADRYSLLAVPSLGAAVISKNGPVKLKA